MMATFYPILRSQGDDVQSQYSGDGQKLASCSESPAAVSSATIYVNQASVAGSYTEILSGSTLSQNCADFPSVQARNEMVFIPSTSNAMDLQSIAGQFNTEAGNLVSSSVNVDSHVVPSIQLGILDGEHNFQGQGLSLSLGTHMQSEVTMPSIHYQYPNLVSPSFFSTHLPALGNASNQNKDLESSECLSGFAGGNQDAIKTEASLYPGYLTNHKDVHTYKTASETLGCSNTILNSKYLKAAQQLLDEVVNVKKVLKQHEPDKCSNDLKDKNPPMLPKSSWESSVPDESIANPSPELPPAERQDLQNKKTKLFYMLDEVDRRYKQYYYQMQIVVSSFEMVAGHGTAKSYTSLALQTIGRHFRCLRDAITGQIEATRKRLGEQDALSGQGGIPRMRYVDHNFRQQRAFQQLGMMRHAWRPQRGLPESSVSVLRAWLFEHFLHPYPNDSEKLVLAKQTGLTRNQVANWFINARVRLWKPMIEDMYKEEFGDPEANSKSSADDATKAHGENRLDELQDSVTSNAADLQISKPTAETMGRNRSVGGHVTDSGIVKFQHDGRSNIVEQILNPDEHTPHNQNGDGSFMSAVVTYDMSELSGFTVGSQVCLALGLQHHETDAIPMSGETYLRNNHMEASSVGHDAADYHCVDPGKQQDRFGSTHLLHDFVV